MRILVFLTLLWSASLFADELRPAALRFEAMPSGETTLVWQLPMNGDNQILPLKLFINDEHFDTSQGMSYRQGTYWVVRQNLSVISPFNVQVKGLNDTNTELLVSLTFPDGAYETQRLQQDSDRLNVDWKKHSDVGVWAYVGLGIEHILIGADHLLFVASLMLLVTRMRMLIWTITAFTAAHSLTLGAASMGWLQLPIAPVEAVIALSIVFVAREVVTRERGIEDLSSRYPWIVAFCFGLLHGLGFASVLADIGLPEDAKITALLLFNVGVEMGQLVFVLALVGALHVLKRFVPAAWFRPTYPAYLIGAIAAFWMIERTVWF